MVMKDSGQTGYFKVRVSLPMEGLPTGIPPSATHSLDRD